MAGAEGVYKDAAGAGDADGVGYLHHHLVCYAGSHHIFGDVACCISCAAVHLARILAGKCTAAVGAATPVGVNYYLASREAGVTGWATYYKLAGRVNVQDNVVAKKCCGLGTQTGFQARQKDVFHVAADACRHGFVAVKFVVLGRKHYGVHPHRASGFAVIFDCELAFCIGPQVRHRGILLAADFCQRAEHQVGENQRQGHILITLVACIAEHDPLVAGALLVFAGAVHAAGYVAALLVQSKQNRAGIAVKLIIALGIADSVDGFAGHLFYVHVGAAGRFAANQRQAGGYKCLTGHVCRSIAP